MDKKIAGIMGADDSTHLSKRAKKAKEVANKSFMAGVEYMRSQGATMPAPAPAPSPPATADDNDAELQRVLKAHLA